QLLQPIAPPLDDRLPQPRRVRAARSSQPDGCIADITRTSTKPGQVHPRCQPNPAHLPFHLAYPVRGVTESRDFRCERRLIEEAQRINHPAKCSCPSSTMPISWSSSRCAPICRVLRSELDGPAPWTRPV